MKIRIKVIMGSQNDLKQCAGGLKELNTRVSHGQAEVTVHIMSCHRHTKELDDMLQGLAAACQTDVIIAAAGKAAALPGHIDAVLRNRFNNTAIRVIGVALDSAYAEDRQAAVLSITRVPGTQVIYAGQGCKGFKNACLIAACGDMNQFPAIKLKEIPPSLHLTLNQACEMASAA